ncbi:MAG: hypothetical protein HKN34_06290 [Gammaproteobacteria bacterium]|nr:hypothetical protein [Gammaproteobacteria bacterium]
MMHNVVNESKFVNIMDQDVALGITGSVTQADLAPLRNADRLGEYALIYRVERVHQGGGYGDQDKHPMAWAVAVYVDGQLCRVFNARGAGREWNSIDRLSSWLRDQGFWCWWTRNDLEPVGTALTESETDETVSPAPEHFPEPPLPL